jgi:hypothetical protein
MRTFAITEHQLTSIQGGLGRALSNLEVIGVNTVLGQVYAAEIKPTETEGKAEQAPER